MPRKRRKPRARRLVFEEGPEAGPPEPVPQSRSPRAGPPEPVPPLQAAAGRLGKEALAWKDHR